MNNEVITPHFYAKFEPYDPELIDNLQGKLSLCYLGQNGDDVTVCSHLMRLDEDHRLKSNLAFGDPPKPQAIPDAEMQVFIYTQSRASGRTHCQRCAGRLRVACSLDPLLCRCKKGGASPARATSSPTADGFDL